MLAFKAWASFLVAQRNNSGDIRECLKQETYASMPQVSVPWSSFGAVPNEGCCRRAAGEEARLPSGLLVVVQRSLTVSFV